jgi:ABC-type Fe3+ transport system substrate-binding protein
VATLLTVFVQAYNTNQLKKDDLPKSYQDLLNPKWKGKLGIETEDFDWFAAVVTDMGEAKGMKLFRDIVATNGISVRKGHSLLNNMVAAGEVPLALTVYNYMPEASKKRGDRLVCTGTGDCPCQRDRNCTAGSACECGTALLRLYVVDRGSENTGLDGLCAN